MRRRTLLPLRRRTLLPLRRRTLLPLRRRTLLPLRRRTLLPLRRRTLLTLPGMAALSAAAQSSLPLADKQPGAGFAERDITPSIGSEQPGNYYKRFNESVHDPCKVRAAVFTDGSGAAALVSVDALIVPRALVLAARQRISKLTSIAPEAVLIGATHTHSGGPVGMVQPGEFDGAPAHIQQLAKLSTEADPKYLQRVEDASVDAVVEAFRARRAYACGVASGVEEKSAFNRRFRMRNGQAWTHPQAGNPDMLEAAGPVGPEVGVIGAGGSAGAADRPGGGCRQPVRALLPAGSRHQEGQPFPVHLAGDVGQWVRRPCAHGRGAGARWRRI